VSASDLERLNDVRYRYAEGIDHLDWDLYRSVFCDELEVAMMTTATEPAPVLRHTTADRWVARVRTLVSGLAATQHVMFNARAQIRGDTATLTTSMQAEHFLDFEHPDSWYTIGGYYTDGLRRTADGWRIAAMRLTLFWHRGNPEVLAEAVARSDAGRPARRSQPPPGSARPDA
jgi:3-phenylpropionate/cinnamic acid dioxygenase small subunit